MSETNEPRSPTSAAASHPYSTREAYLVLWSMVIISVTMSLCSQPFTQVVDPVRKSFGITDIQFSLLVGVFAAVPSVAMSVGGGWLVDRLSRRRLLLTIMFAWTAGAIWGALAQSYEQLAMSRIIVVGAAAVKFPLAMTWINDAFPAERRGRAIGLFFVVMGVGPALGSTLTGLVLHAAESGALSTIPLLGHREPWRLALALLALTNVPFFFLVASLRDARPKEPSSLSSTSTEGGARFPIALIVAMVAAISALGLADNASLSWLPTVLRRQHQFDAQEVGFAFGVITTVGGCLGPLIGGYLGDWAYGRKGTVGRLQVCAIASLVSAPLVAFYAVSSSSLLITALLLNAVSSVLAMVLGYVAFQALLPSKRRGLATGLASALAGLFAAAGPTMVAFVSEGLTPRPAALGEAVAIVTAVTFVLAALAYVVLAWRVVRWETGSKDQLTGCRPSPDRPRASLSVS